MKAKGVLQFSPSWTKGAAIVRSHQLASSAAAALRRGAAAHAERRFLLGASLAASALALLAGRTGLDALSLAPLSHHMSVHILLMSFVAPLLALGLTSAGVHARSGGRALAAATVGQIGALWAAHAPPVPAATMHAPALDTGVQMLLLGFAVWFWTTVLAQAGAARWRALVALLITGKLFCLLAALLVFAPRNLYPALASGHRDAAGAALADQQLAGLLMIVACPSTYVLAAVLIAARWLSEIGAHTATPASPGDRCG